MAADKTESPKDMTVPELKEALKQAGEPTSGKKDELVERLEEVGLNDTTDYKPDVFYARFDPTDPPEEDPGPVVSE